MKKLLVLLLVLGLSSVANASLANFDLETDGLVLQIIGTTPGAGVDAYTIVENADMDIIVPQSTGFPKEYAAAGDLKAIAVGSAPPGDIAMITAATVVDPILAELWFEVEISADMSGLGIGDTVTTVDIYDKNLELLGTKDVISTIPEPMTIALLGLGGLFLRRRR